MVLAHSQAEAGPPSEGVQLVPYHQWVSEFVLCEYQSAGLVEVTSSWVLTQTHRMSDKEHHCALVAGGENDFRPVLVVRRTASAIVAAVRSPFQHFSARLAADIHALAVPGWKQRPAELCPDMIADVTDR